MRLIDLLESAKKTQDIIVRDDWALGIIYSERFNCYIWCDKSGKAIYDTTDITGFKRVVLSAKLLEEGNWYLIPSRIDKLEKIKELHYKIKKKNYAERRVEEIANKFNITELIEDYYKLGASTAYGNVMYMLDQDFDKKDIKKFILDGTKDDIQFRSDVFGVWGELMDKSR